MRLRHSTFVFLCAGTGVWGQTQIDLSSQAKSVDFSNAAATRPNKTGSVLPATCKVGDVFFKTDALPGANLFGCPVVNAWVQMTGTSGITDSQVSNTATTVSIAAGIFRTNNVITTLPSMATIEANAGSLAGGAQVWIEYDSVSQNRVVVSNFFVNQAGLSLANIGLGAANASGFTPGRIPIATCTGGFVPDQWNSCIDMRASLSGVKINAGYGMQVTNESDGSITLSSPVSYGDLVCASASSSGTTYTCAMSPTLKAYSIGMVLHWIPDMTATGGATTLNVDALGAITVTLSNGSSNPANTDIIGGQLYGIWYDGSKFRMLGKP
jgi:hypothetical protein